MSTVLEIASARIENADVAIAAAKATGLPAFVAFALLDMESEGRNFFGSDSGGMFKGETVTQAKFEAMEKAVAAGKPSNGVGPTQITYRGFFPQARAQGLKLWEPYDNMIFGFTLLAGYLKTYPGDYQKAGRLFNGKDSYGNTFVRVVGEWKERLKGAGEETPVATYHVAPSLLKLRDETDAAFPKRSKASDGTIGDASHAARASDHNPDNDSDSMPKGAVSAIDITATDSKVRAAVLAAVLEDPRVNYVINKNKIYSSSVGWKVRNYQDVTPGGDPHTNHIHVSLKQTKAAHDDTSSWGVGKDTPSEPTPPPVKLIKLDANVVPGKRAPQVTFLKRLLKAAGYAKDFSAGDLASNLYGSGTQDAVNRFHKANGKFASTGRYDPTIGPLGFQELQRQAPNVKG